MSATSLQPESKIRNSDNSGQSFGRVIGRGLGSVWGGLLFFAIASAFFTWPLITHLSDTLPDWGDAADSSWRLGSIARQLLTDPFHLYQTNAFYPLSNGLALDELLTGQGLLAAPLIWLTANPPLAYNLLVFVSFTLSGFAMWLLVRHLTSSGAAGLVAGMIYAYSPWHYGQYGHLGLGAQHYMIFALYFLIRFLEATYPNQTIKLITRRTLLLLGAFIFFAVLQAIVAGYYAYFTAILVGLYLIYHYLFALGICRWTWRKVRHKSPNLSLDWRDLGRQFGLLAVAGLLALVLVFPFVWPFKQAQDQFTFHRDLTEISYWSAAPNSLLRTMPTSWLYRPIQRGVFGLQTSAERMLYPGLVAVILALIGLVKNRKSKIENRKSKISSVFGPVSLPTHNPISQHSVLSPQSGLSPDPRWLFAFVSLSGLILSFGPSLNLEAYGLNPTGLTLPYKWLYDLLPGFDALRVPQRFGQLFMLGLAVCAGYGVAGLLGVSGQGSGVGEKADRKTKAGRNFRFSIFDFRLGIKNLSPKFPLSPDPRPLTPILTLLLIGLIGADYFAPNQPAQLTPTGENTPAVYRWLASQEATRLVPENAILLELPISSEKTPVNTGPLYLMYGLGHHRPMLNGSANIIPYGYERLFFEMQSFPAPATLDIIEGLGVQYLVIHPAGLSSEANRAELEQAAGPDGRLELVKNFEAAGGKDTVYRVKPAPARFQRLRAALPEGAEVFLGDHPNQRRLLTTALPKLIGPNRRYFSLYPTIYGKLANNIQPAQARRVYQYAIFYRGLSTSAEYGYNLADLLLDEESLGIQLYMKRN